MSESRRPLRAGSLRSNTLWMGGGLALRFGIQGLYFILIAKALGPRGYGAFIGVMAVVQIAAPFASWGSGNLLVREVARDRSRFPLMWGRAIGTTSLIGGAIALALTAFSGAIFEEAIPWGLVLCLGLSELIAGRIAEIAAQAFQAIERMHRTAAIHVVPSVVKLLGAAFGIAFLSPVSPLEWGLVYLVASLSAATLAVRLVSSEIGQPDWTPPSKVWFGRDGFHFATSLAAQSSYNDIDKTLLTRIASLPIAGRYAAAYRVVDVALTPLRAVLFASYARFFAAGREGIRSAASVARVIAPITLVSGAVIAVGLFVAAPLLPRLLEEGYEETAEMLRLLSPLPLLKAASYLPADLLTGADRQSRRSWVQVSIAALNVVLSVAWIEAYGWRGAAIASLLCDALLAVGLWACVITAAKSEGKVSRPIDVERKLLDV